MAEKLQKQLKEVGSKLENPPANKDALIKLLKQGATYLCELEQSPSKEMLESMQPFINAIVKPELLKHQDKEVKLLVATCTCEITRVTAPEAPFDDHALKDIFHLIVSSFGGLKDTKNPSFGRRVTILETVAKYRSCIVMLDLECDDLINQMFTTFFSVASDEHSETVITSMKTIMVVLLEESEDISDDLLLIILSVLGRDKKEITMAARKLGMNVIAQCAGKLEPSIKQFIVKSMSGESNHSIDYHEVIYDIYRCAPQAIAGIVPYVTGELLTDKIELRLKAVKLAGDLFSIPGSRIHEMFQPIFLEFLKRLSDRVVEVRMSVLEHVKLCMLSDPFRPEAPQIIAALCDRLLDYDESIRQKVVAVVSDIKCHELSSVSAETIKLVAERLRDKSLPVKKYTMERLSDIYRTFCLKNMGSLTLTLTDDYDWIPGRILRCFYDKDFRSDTVEHILCISLFPAEFSTRDKVKNWVRLFSKFDKVEVKALEKILEQKQRLQLELQKYLSFRQMYKDSDSSELQKKAAVCFRFMSHCFTDPTKAESDFQLLHQLKDANVWKIMTMLLDPNVNSLQTWKYREELLKIVGQKHPLYGFLSTLSIRCSYILFNKDYVNDVILEVEAQKSSKNKLLTQSCMSILVILGSFCPLLLCGTEKELVRFLEDENEVIKEGVLHVLAKAGGTIREQLGESSSTLDLLLERICVEGGRKQAKYAVHALASITKDDGLKSLSVLYKRLVDMLEKKTHLPSVLQSLGCIAQTAMPVFETQETKIKDFIRKDILGCSEKKVEKTKESWDDRSELCSLKIFGIKTLVKSYLPMKDANLRVGIDELIKDLGNILSFGEISKDIESRCVDKAHLKLSSAKAILRLSKHWDTKIPIDVFYLTLRISQVEFPQVKKLFLNKVHQYIKDKSLDPKYACAFLSDLGSQLEKESEDAHNLSDIIQMCQQAKARQVSVQSDGNSSLVVYPENILPYLIHALAHHPLFPDIDECKDVKAYEKVYRKLYLFVSMLALGEEGGNSLKKEEVVSIVSILKSIRNSEDAVDTNMSKKLYAICDLCFSITKRLAQKQEDLKESVVQVSLPEALYKSLNKKEEEKDEKKEEEKDEKKEEEKDEKKEEEKDEKKEEEKDEKKEEGDSDVTEGHTWLADAAVLAHFDSLNMEANDENVPSKVMEDDLVKDSETEVPLGKLLKQIKAKKAVKNGPTPIPIPAAGGDAETFDILGMVREMNLDNLVSSMNGHEEPKSDEKPKRKRSTKESSINVSKSLSKTNNKRSKSELSAFDNIKRDDENDVDKHVDADVSDLDEKPKKPINIDGNQKSGSVRKRKRRSVLGLTKCTAKEVESQSQSQSQTHTTDLIGKRIKVWWPMDKEYYEGLVKSYDHQKKKHVVLYNDGDVEVLRLDKEQWEFLGKPTKSNRSSKSPRPKGGSSKKNNKSLNNVRSIYEELSDISPSSMVRGKRTPRKNLKQRSLKCFETEKKEDSDVDATFSKVNNLDTEEETSNREGGNSADEEKQNKDIKNKFKEMEGDSEQKETENDDDDEDDEEEEESNKSELEDVEAEFSDDMPLGVWKNKKIRKAEE